MQESTYFDNQIVKVQNLEFQRDSTDYNIINNFLTFTNQTGGIVTGLNVYSGTGLTVNVSQGFAYTDSGERMEAYSGVTFIATSGMVWAQLVESDFNPDPASSYASFPAYATAQSNINPVNGSEVNVSNFNTLFITQVSGDGVIPLARINADGSDIKSIDLVSPYRQNLKLVGILDINTSTIDGAIISLGSIDSNRFVYPLHYDIGLSGININNTVSGVGNIGTPTFPMGAISAKILNVTIISGLSPVHFKSQILLDNNDSIINTEGTNGLRLNPSGQDVYIGGDVPGLQGRLWTNHISPRFVSTTPVFPSLTLDGYIINMNTAGVPSLVPSLNINAYAGVDIISPGTVSSPGIKISGTKIDLMQDSHVIGIPNSRLTMSNGVVALDTGILNVVASAPGGNGSVNISVLGGNGAITLDSTNIAIASGSLISNVNFSNTRQQFKNLVSNPDLIINDLVTSQGAAYATSGTTPYPADWYVSTPSPSKTSVGPFLFTNATTQENFQFLSFPTTLNQSIQGLFNYTIEFQFKLNSYTNSNIPTSQYSNIWSQAYGVLGTPRIEIYGNNVGDAKLYYVVNSFVNETNPGITPININQWYAGAVTFSGVSGNNGILKLFVDNKQVGLPNATSASKMEGNGTAAIINSIGNYVASMVQTFNGEIANFRISNYAKPSGTFASGLTTYQPGGTNGVEFGGLQSTIAYWRFDNSLKDSANNGNAPTLFNPAGYDLINAGKSIRLNNYKNDAFFSTKSMNYNTDPDIALVAGNDYYLSVSGSQFLNQTATFSTPISELKPNTRYNVSFWANAVNSSYDWTVNLGGTISNTSTETVTGWKRKSVVLTTPNALPNSINYMSLSIKNTGVVPSLQDEIRIAAVQITESSALLPYNRSGSRTLIYKQSTASQTISNFWVPVQDWTFNNVTTGGGKIIIDATIYLYQSPGSSAFYKIIVDGKEVASQPARKWGGPAITMNHKLNWEGILAAGQHTFIVQAWFDQGLIIPHLINIEENYGLGICTFRVTEE